MNSIVKVENYLNDHETGGFLDDDSMYNGGSSIAEFHSLFDPGFEPWLIPVQYENIPELSLKDIEEITCSLDDEQLTSFHQENSTVVDALPTTTTIQSQCSNDQNNIMVNVKPMHVTTTNELQYFQTHYGEPVYSTTITTEPQYFQTHNGEDVYATTMTTEPQYFYNHDFGYNENVVRNSMIMKGDYAKFSFPNDEFILADAKPLCMIPSRNLEPLCFSVPAANDFGNFVKDEDLKGKESRSTSMVKYEDGVVLRQNGKSKTSALEHDEIRKYFDMPITKAAKELNVGLTVLKKRCRELNIMRWPHRKIKSLQCLIDNVKEMGMTSKKEIDMLEEQKKMLEIVPELELSESTKRLRRSSFKANYKKKKIDLICSPRLLQDNVVIV